MSTATMKLIGLYTILSFVVSACNSDQRFGIQETPVSTSPIECGVIGDPSDVQIAEINEVGNVISASLQAERVVWSLALPDGSIQRIESEDLEYEVSAAGNYQMRVDAFDNCDNFVSQAYAWQSFLPIGNTSFSIENGNPYTNRPSVSLQFVAENATEMYVSNDPTCQSGGVWESLKSQRNWRLPLLNASNTISVKYRNGSEIETPCLNASILHDNVLPAFNFAQVPTNPSNSGLATVSLSIVENGSGLDQVICSLDSGSAQVCSNPYVFNSLVDGQHTVSFLVTDRAGNASEWQQYTWVVDSQRPSVQITQAPNTPTRQQSASFEFTAVDQGLGVNLISCSLDGAPYQACQSPLNLQNLSEGTHRLSIIAADIAGNVSDPAEHTWQIDITAPSVQITSTPSNPSRQTNATIAFTAQGLNTGDLVECRLNASAWVSCSSPVAYNNLADTSHTFEVRAIDQVGNQSQVESYTWAIDSLIPSVQITQAPSSPTRDQTATFEFSANDSGLGVDRIECSLDGGAYQICQSPLNLQSLSEGSHGLSVIAYDLAGNVSDPATHNWQIDTTAPIIQITSVPANPSRVLDASFSFTAQDALGVDRIECRLNTAAWSNCSSPQNYSNLAETTHRFDVRAIDTVGNISAVVSYTWLVDQNFQQDEITITEGANLVDVVMVIDNTDRFFLASRFSLTSVLERRFSAHQFLEDLEETDYRLGVITTDPVDRGRQGGGILQDFTGSRYGLWMDNQNNGSNAFENTIIDTATGRVAFYEQGIRSMHAMLDAPQNQEFFREGAHLMTIVVSDRDEMASEELNSAESLIDHINTKWPGKGYTHHSIVVEDGDRSCRNSFTNGEFGLEYIRLSQLTDGIVADICGGSYNRALENMLDNINKTSKVTLSCVPEDRDNDGQPDITVELDPEPNPSIGYSLNGNELIFDSEVAVGTKVKVSYFCP